MFKKIKFIIYTRAFIFFAYWVVRIYSLTFRLKVVNEKKWQDMLKQGKTILICCWHQQFFPAIHHFKSYSSFNPGIMISQSRDGDLISWVARKNGWHIARGSSSRGGKKAMDAMIHHLEKYRLGAHILDGPTGPMGKVKAGAIKMARDTGAFAVPVYTRADRAWFFNSWDRFMVPKPFSRVTITFGDGLLFSPDDPLEKFEDQRLFLEKTMLPGLIQKQVNKIQK